MHPDIIPQDEIELFYNHDHINTIKLEKAAWETADAGRAERARKMRLEYLDQRTCRLPDEWPALVPTTAAATPTPTGGDTQRAMAHSELATLPSSEEFEPLPESDLEATDLREAPLDPEPEPPEPPEPAESGAGPPEPPDRGSVRSPEPSSDRETEPELAPEPLFVTPQLPPAFVLNEVDTSLFVVDQPRRLTVCDDQFKDEQSKKHERRIENFAQRWTAVGDFMSAEHSGREDAKLEQMTSLHGSLKPSLRYRAFAEVMRDNYRIQLAEIVAASAQQQVETEKSAKKKKK
ncbi:hypothetical protein FJT64_001063 [Amphibalanus amphitrite]|uniref:Uncharacterized protein n=1 Tax=Amphibalanus amphitrite TaxID=1232801 RepID=A0A6A4VFW4_AMPAM|nr:hypothetical protein FJT64_001063 [Amphibalanus amphitrite]